jgi:hypothetical protein
MGEAQIILYHRETNILHSAGGWMIPTSPMDPIWIDNASGDPGVYFTIQVDPVPCTGTINEVTCPAAFTKIGSRGLTWFDSTLTTATPLQSAVFENSNIN